MEVMHCTYHYTPLKEGTRRIYKNNGSFPPELPKDEDIKDTLFLTASTKNYHMLTTGDIRVLSLLPGLFNDPLRCQLTVRPIEQQPTYDAISYVWGNPSGIRIITVDNDQAIPITVSLDNALRHIRLQNKVRNLWVDAVCINQSDIKERSSQVPLMKEIYSRARLAAVWIDVKLSPDNNCVRRLLSLEEDTILDDIGDDPKFWEPLIPLLQNPYWERLWVQQELVFAPKLEFHCRGVTIPGEKLMAFQLQIFLKSSQRQDLFHIPDTWTMLGNQMGISKTLSRNLGLWREMLKYKVPVDPFTLKPDYSLQKPLAEWQLDPNKWGTALSACPIYLLGMLRYAQGLNVTDPRDRINASLNLVIDYEDDGFLISYETTLAECYFRVALLLPFKCNSLQFLPQAKLLQYPDKTVKGLPSWAPNWNPPRNAGYFWAPFRTAGSLPMYSYPFQSDLHDGIFHARGFLYSELKQTVSRRDNSHTPLSVLTGLFFSATKASAYGEENITKLAHTLTGPALAECSLSLSHFSNMEATLYMGVLLCYASITPGLRICDLVPCNTEYYNQSQTIVASIRTLQEFQHLYPPILKTINLNHLSSKIPANIDQNQRLHHFIHLATHTLSSGCLASTFSGNLAITEGNAAVDPDDEIWILFGCPVPIVLRSNRPHFKVVSPAYIHDIMNGEAVEGVLTPDDPLVEWETALRKGEIGPRPEHPYVSGKGKWLVRIISLC